MRWISHDTSAMAAWRPKLSGVQDKTVSTNENDAGVINSSVTKASNFVDRTTSIGGNTKAIPTVSKLQKGLSYRLLNEPVPEGGACILVYEPDSSGRLVEHYSKRSLQGVAAVGRWTAGHSKKIASFKFNRNAGRNVLIGNCSAGVLGRKNYCSGWCQFVKSAKILDGDVTIYDVPTGLKAMPVDVYLYYDDNRPGYQSVKLEAGKPYTTNNLLAVSCIPKNTQFYENMTVDILKWLQDGNNYGYSSKI